MNLELLSTPRKNSGSAGKQLIVMVSWLGVSGPCLAGQACRQTGHVVHTRPVEWKIITVERTRRAKKIKSTKCEKEHREKQYDLGAHIWSVTEV